MLTYKYFKHVWLVYSIIYLSLFIISILNKDGNATTHFSEFITNFLIFILMFRIQTLTEKGDDKNED